MVIRVVLDTNVFISGIFWEGNFCSKIISAWKSRKFVLVSSLPIIEELIVTLRTFKIDMEEEMIQEWCNMIIENSLIVGPTEKLNVVIADPKDDKFFEAALAGDAQFIVSQDNHLLKIGNYQGIQVILPEEFLKLL